MIKTYAENNILKAVIDRNLDNDISDIVDLIDLQHAFLTGKEEVLLFQFNKNIEQTQCDVFDYLIIEYLKSIGVTNYISDDKDFMSVEDIQLFSTYG